MGRGLHLRTRGWLTTACLNVGRSGNSLRPSGTVVTKRPAGGFDAPLPKTRPPRCLRPDARPFDHPSAAHEPACEGPREWRVGCGLLGSHPSAESLHSDAPNPLVRRFGWRLPNGTGPSCLRPMFQSQGLQQLTFDGLGDLLGGGGSVRVMASSARKGHPLGDGHAGFRRDPFNDLGWNSGALIPRRHEASTQAVKGCLLLGCHHLAGGSSHGPIGKGRPPLGHSWCPRLPSVS